MLPVRAARRLPETVLAFDEEGQFLFGRFAAENGVAVREAAEPLDDLEMQPGHVPVRPAAG